MSDFPFVSNDDDEANRDDDCPRARVPRPSTKDDINQPRSTVDISEKKNVHRLDSLVVVISLLSSRSLFRATPNARGSRLWTRWNDDHRNATRHSKPMSIVKLNVEGNRMHLEIEREKKVQLYWCFLFFVFFSRNNNKHSPGLSEPSLSMSSRLFFSRIKEKESQTSFFCLLRQWFENDKPEKRIEQIERTRKKQQTHTEEIGIGRKKKKNERK